MLKMKDGYVPQVNEFVTMVHEPSLVHFTGMFKRLEKECVKLSTSISYTNNQKNPSMNLFGFVPINTHGDDGTDTIVTMRAATEEEIKLVDKVYSINSFERSDVGEEITDMSSLEDGILYKLYAPNEPCYTLATHSKALSKENEPAFTNYVNVHIESKGTSEMVDMPLYIKKGRPSRVYVPTRDEWVAWYGRAKDDIARLGETIAMVKDSIDTLERIIALNLNKEKNTQ